jgi:phospholipase C
LTGTVTLSCKIASGAAPLPTCSFSQPMVTVSGTVPAVSTLTIASAPGSPGGSYSISITAVDAQGMAPANGVQTLTLANAAVIQHIVVIIQENRSTDNLFQDPVLVARGADIASSGVNSVGATIPLMPIDLGTSGANPQNYDLVHSHASFVAMYDGGKMDGADLIVCTPAAECPPNAHPNPQFMYVAPSDVQPYFAMAEQYTFADRMFQTNEGPSFPAHQFFLGGTSAPTATSTLFAAENPIHSNIDPAGCIAPASNTVAMIDATGSETAQPPQYPCFEHPTLTDLIDSKGLTWRYYTPTPGSIWSAPDAIEHICQQQIVSGQLICTGAEWTANVVLHSENVLTDVANGQLAQVTWVIPDGKHSDHALVNDGSGPSWVASVVNAIGSNSAFWANTVIIITWDDWGGWYDHVAPKVINDGVSWGSGYAYGFRVPLIVVSAYAKPAYISHVTHDFGSILKFIEETFGLPSLGYADVPADDLSDCFNLTKPPLTFSTIAAPLKAAHFLNYKGPPTDPDDD